MPFTQARSDHSQKPARLFSAKRTQGRSTVKLKSCLTAIATLAVTTLLIAPAFAAPASPAEVYGKLFSGQAEEVVAAAEAMPADKYNFVPTSGEFKGVRTFGQQVTHIADAQYFFFSGFGVKPTIDPKSIATLTNKDDIVKALKDSFAFAEQAMKTITPENAFEKIANVDGTDTRASIAAFGLAHTNDHYGQMVVYLRLNGIIPPASRK
jgi:uncharacterized damage-inducible protein DinB